MRCYQCPIRGDYCVINQVGTVTLPPPILLEFEASQHTTQKVNRTELYTRWRWSPAIQTSSWSRWAKQAVPNPARQSETLKTTPEVPLGTRAAGPSWQNGVFTFLHHRRRGHSTPPVSKLQKLLVLQRQVPRENRNLTESKRVHVRPPQMYTASELELACLATLTHPVTHCSDRDSAS